VAEAREAVPESATLTPPTTAPPEVKPGPGATALEALLKTGQPPSTKDVIAVIDGHRGERDALFALLHKSLGNAYVQQVTEEMDRLRLSIERKELVAGDPSNPEGGHFRASAEQQGASWRTDGGGFSGTVGKAGLDTTIKTGERDAIHAQVDKDKSGTIAWERDGKSQGELYGRYGGSDDYSAGARRTWGVGDGGSLTTDARRTVAGGSTTDALYGGYKSGDGKTTADGMLGVRDGGFVGSLSGAHTRTDGSSVTGRLAQDATGTTAAGGYRSADGKTIVDGTGFRAPDGSLGGSLSGSRTRADGSVIGGELSHDRAGTTALSGSYRDGETQATGRLTHGTTGTALAGTYTDGKTALDGSVQRDPEGRFAGSLSGTRTRDDGSVIGAGLSHDLAGTTALTGSYKDKDTQLSGRLAHDAAGTTTLGASGTQTLGSGATLSGSGELARRADGVFTGQLQGAYSDKDTKIDGSVARGVDRWSLGAGVSQQFSPELSGSARLQHVQPDVGKGQTTLTLSEQYKSGRLLQGFDLTAGRGERDYLQATGSLDAQLGKQWYGGAFGSFSAENGKQTTASLGASLTFTPNEKTALTLAGIVDEHGTVETRLQLDVFKKKIDGVAGLASSKKDALVSLFLSYSTDSGRGSMLDSRYGAPSYSAGRPTGGGGSVMGGIKINF